MLDSNFLDEAARILAMPIPRRKAFKHLAVGFAGTLVYFLWPSRATASSHLPCTSCAGHCNTTPPCQGRHVGDACRVGGKVGHCAKQLVCEGGSFRCCTCIPGAPVAPDITTIPDVAITRESSLAAGNCRDGTDWVLSWFPGRQRVSAREAALAAINRGQPIVAREIARTAHLIHRDAKM